MGTIDGEETMEVAAPREQVYAAISDIDSHPKWQSGVKRVDVKERDSDGRPLIAELVSDAKVKDIRYELRYTHESPSRMSWSYLDGDVKDMSGFYAIEELSGGQSRLTFHLRVDPGRRLGLLLRGPVVDKVRSYVMGTTMQEIREHVESGARATA